jgi:hypothetical protein
MLAQVSCYNAVFIADCRSTMCGCALLLHSHTAAIVTAMITYALLYWEFLCQT